MNHPAKNSGLRRRRFFAFVLCCGALVCLTALADDYFIFDNSAPAAPGAPKNPPRPQPAAVPKKAAPPAKVERKAVTKRALTPAAPRQVIVQGRLQINGPIQPGIAQQIRLLLQPMVKAELSFAVRVAKPTDDEKKALIAGAKKWFDEFAGDFVKNQSPNQQQMFLQGAQGVWMGGRPNEYGNPRDAIREGVAKVVAAALPREKFFAYKNECRLRSEFAHQVCVENLVERIDEKVKLSPEQWKKINKSLDQHLDPSEQPQLESFAISNNMWPGVPDQWVIPELGPAQQMVIRRINRTRNSSTFFGGGVFGMMFGGGDDGAIDDIQIEFDPPGKEKAKANPAAAEGDVLLFSE
jgi:hypothetical protein